MCRTGTLREESIEGCQGIIRVRVGQFGNLISWTRAGHERELRERQVVGLGLELGRPTNASFKLGILQGGSDEGSLTLDTRGSDDVRGVVRSTGQREGAVEARKVVDMAVPYEHISHISGKGNSIRQ